MRQGRDTCEGCPKLLKPVEQAPDPIVAKRLTFLVRVESMVNVGCKFSPNDLPMQVWDELIALTIERQRMDRLVDEHKNPNRRDAASERRVNELRKEVGIPPPGGSIFPRQKPVK